MTARLSSVMPDTVGRKRAAALDEQLGLVERLRDRIDVSVHLVVEEQSNQRAGRGELAGRGSRRRRVRRVAAAARPRPLAELNPESRTVQRTHRVAEIESANVGNRRERLAAARAADAAAASRRTERTTWRAAVRSATNRATGAVGAAATRALANRTARRSRRRLAFATEPRSTPACRDRAPRRAPRSPPGE